MKAVTLTTLCLAILSPNVQASSPQAWAAFEKDIATRCVKASALKNTAPVGTVALFEDSVDYAALLLQGTYPQRHMKGKRGTELCLYNKKTNTPYVTEWDSVQTGITKKAP